MIEKIDKELARLFAAIVQKLSTHKKVFDVPFAVLRENGMGSVRFRCANVAICYRIRYGVWVERKLICNVERHEVKPCIWLGDSPRVFLDLPLDLTRRSKFAKAMNKYLETIDVDGCREGVRKRSIRSNR